MKKFFLGTKCLKKIGVFLSFCHLVSQEQSFGVFSQSTIYATVSEVWYSNKSLCIIIFLYLPWRTHLCVCKVSACYLLIVLCSNLPWIVCACVLNSQYVLLCVRHSCPLYTFLNGYLLCLILSQARWQLWITSSVSNSLLVLLSIACKTMLLIVTHTDCTKTKLTC